MKNKSVGAIADFVAFYVRMRANFFDTDGCKKQNQLRVCLKIILWIPKCDGGRWCTWPGHGSPSASTTPLSFFRNRS
jgi:hypothetical protein